MSFRIGFGAFLMTTALVGMSGCGDDEEEDDDTQVETATLPNCTSSGQPAFATYGTTAFVAVNESIVQNVIDQTGGDLESPELGSSFTSIGSRVANFKGNLAAFLVYAYGGPESITYTDNVSYNGVQDMTQAHTGLAITSAQYDFFVSDIVVPALTDNGVPTTDVSSCFAPVITDATFKASIVGK